MEAKDDTGRPASAPTPEALAGWCEAASRMLRPLLAAPGVQTRLRILLAHVDPDYAPVLVRTLLETDAALPLAALSALPRLANTAIEGAAELARQIGRFPPALLGGVVTGLLGELRPRPLGEAIGRLARVVIALPAGHGEEAAFWRQLGEGLRSGLDAGAGPGPDGEPSGASPALAAHVAGLASAVADLLTAHPELVAALAEPLAEALAAHPALVQRGLRPLLEPLHEALHRAPEGAAPDPEAPR